MTVALTRMQVAAFCALRLCGQPVATCVKIIGVSHPRYMRAYLTLHWTRRPRFSKYEAILPAVERDYCAGLMTRHAIGARYGIPITTLDHIAKHRKWQRPWNFGELSRAERLTYRKIRDTLGVAAARQEFFH